MRSFGLGDRGRLIPVKHSGQVMLFEVIGVFACFIPSPILRARLRVIF